MCWSILQGSTTWFSVIFGGQGCKEVTHPGVLPLDKGLTTCLTASCSVKLFLLQLLKKILTESLAIWINIWTRLTAGICVLDYLSTKFVSCVAPSGSWINRFKVSQHAVGHVKTLSTMGSHLTGIHHTADEDRNNLPDALIMAGSVFSALSCPWRSTLKGWKYSCAVICNSTQRKKKMQHVSTSSEGERVRGRVPVPVTSWPERWRQLYLPRRSVREKKWQRAVSVIPLIKDRGYFASWLLRGQEVSDSFLVPGHTIFLQKILYARSCHKWCIDLLLSTWKTR